jgi:hypothetical protein
VARALHRAAAWRRGATRERVGREAGRRHGFAQLRRRLVQRLVGEHERSPVDPDGRLRAQVAVDPDRVGGIDVVRGHEPAWPVGADRDRRKVEAAETPADVAEILRIAVSPV